MIRAVLSAIMRFRILEVERKFCPTLGPSVFFANKGHPPFKNLTYNGSRVIDDKYFDRGNRLWSAGIYVRQRDGFWQAKVYKGGNYVKSQFEEISSRTQIAEYVRKFSKIEDRASQGHQFGLDMIAHMRTTRLSWTAGDFKMVLDTTQFGHEVGEVELEQVVEAEDGSSDDIRIRAEMEAKIEDFMNRHRWAFAIGTPKGKLSAYFEMKRSQGSQRGC